MEHAAATISTRPGDDRLTQSVSRLGHLLELRLSQVLSVEGITARQFNALLHIAENPQPTRGTMAAALRISPQAAGGLSRRLHARGLVTRVHSTPWEPTTFELTASGMKHLSDALPIAVAAEREALSQLSPGAAENLVRSIHELLGS